MKACIWHFILFVGVLITYLAIPHRDHLHVIGHQNVLQAAPATDFSELSGLLDVRIDPLVFLPLPLLLILLHLLGHLVALVFHHFAFDEFDAPGQVVESVHDVVAHGSHIAER